MVPARFGRHVVGALPGGTSIVVESCGNVPQYEQPALTHALVEEFLKEGRVEEVREARATASSARSS
jgi:hypothetical protein